ncbi:formin-like protein 5 [Phasianus colchicus]|uniref:formin-like protein 5 n=1 Tax=Phasianus colchicus TaxID=9054 RepID=UPI00129E0A74|nr:formin-like protein 5 [Phasianus colchicus]
MSAQPVSAARRRPAGLREERAPPAAPLAAAGNFSSLPPPPAPRRAAPGHPLPARPPQPPPRAPGHRPQRPATHLGCEVTGVPPLPPRSRFSPSPLLPAPVAASARSRIRRETDSRGRFPRSSRRLPRRSARQRPRAGKTPAAPRAEAPRPPPLGNSPGKAARASPAPRRPALPITGAAPRGLGGPAASNPPSGNSGRAAGGRTRGHRAATRKGAAGPAANSSTRALASPVLPPPLRRCAVARRDLPAPSGPAGAPRRVGRKGGGRRPFRAVRRYLGCSLVRASPRFSFHE